MLYIKNLKKFYNEKKVKAVDILELALEPSCMACLIGPSGCGKTTTLKLINRLVEPDEGFVELDGVKSHGVPAVQWRRKIGYAIQKIGLLPHLTAGENISLLSKVLKRDQKWIHERTEDLLELMGLNPVKYKNRYPIELSGGEQQRVGLARALMEDPPLLLMDEPFGALDAITRSSLRKELGRIHRKLKKTILIVTHDLNEAFEMGDQVILMQKGSIVQKGRREDFEKNPSAPFVTDFLKQ